MVWLTPPKKGKTSQKEIDRFADKWMDAGKGKPETLDYLKDFKTHIQKDSVPLSKNFLSGHATVSEDSVDGKPAWKITSADKKFNAWVTRNNNYDLLKLTGNGLGNALDPKAGSDHKSDDEVTFSDINKDFGIKKPTGSELADLSESDKSSK